MTVLSRRSASSIAFHFTWQLRARRMKLGGSLRSSTRLFLLEPFPSTTDLRMYSVWLPLTLSSTHPLFCLSTTWHATYAACTTIRRYSKVTMPGERFLTLPPTLPPLSKNYQERMLRAAFASSIVNKWSPFHLLRCHLFPPCFRRLLSTPWRTQVNMVGFASFVRDCSRRSNKFPWIGSLFTTPQAMFLICWLFKGMLLQMHTRTKLLK